MSLGAQVALFVGGACLLIAISASLLSARLAQQQASDQAEAELNSLAANMADRLDLRMFARLREVRNIAELQPLKDIWEGPPATIRAVMEQLQSTLPEYAWIGFATPDGTVRAATKGMLEGASVTARPWFIEGLKSATVQDVHDAKLLAQKLGPSPTGDPFRFVDVAVPVLGEDGTLLGVLGAHMSWGWAAEVRRLMLANLRPEQQTDIWILNGQGETLLGQGFGTAPFGEASISAIKQQRQLTFVDSRTDTGLNSAVLTKGYQDYSGLGWMVIARRPLDVALAPARALALTIIVAGSLLAMLIAALAAFLALRLTRPLHALADNLDLIGRDDAVTTVGWGHGSSDVVRLSSSVRSLLRRIGSAETEEQAAKREAAAMARRLEEKTRRFGEDLNALQILADRDPLTGLLNRRAFQVFASDAMSYFRRYKRQIAVLVVDIDFFKRVNDTFGHAAGDDVIKGVGAIVSSAVRGTDKAARFGGEEFVVLLRETDANGAMIFAERVRQMISAAPMATERSGPVHVTISVGLAMAQAHDRDVEDIIQRADRALYVAKSTGRNRVCTEEEILRDAA